MKTIKIWRAWTTRTKTCSGFAELGAFSAHFGDAQIYITELCEEEIADAAEVEGEKFSHKICIPTQLIGSAYNTCGETILCKSFGHAKHIMQSGQPLERAIELGWFETPQEAVKVAYTQLCERAKK